MKKPITIITSFFLFVILLVSASSLKTFEINETESISLAPQVEDPDADPLVYIFTAPLDETGEWQTTYGDAGEYTVTVTVSDGLSEVSEDILITVNRKEAEPVIGNFEPKESPIEINEGNSIRFVVFASDPNNDQLTYNWKVDGETYTNGNELKFETGYKDAGNYEIFVLISDGMFNVSKEWNLKVNDVDLDAVLGQIEDVTIVETETARLDLPNFKDYGLSHTISEPLGDNNRWKTTYDDAGDYEITIKVEGKDFEGERKVNLKVFNKDRPPKFVNLKGASIREGEVLNIELKAEDPDKDEVSFSAEGLPEGAEFVDNVLVWEPGFDFVMKEKPEDYVTQAFRLLSKRIVVTFTAKSKELEDKKTVSIRVKDANRPFVLEEIADIDVNEGEEIVLNPAYNDPDKDKVSFKYKGFLNKAKKMTGFDDAGIYVVKVVASDGFFEQTRFVNIKVNDVNQKPEFFNLEDVKVNEDGELRIELSASDPDNDNVKYSISSLPRNAELKGNVFTWKPDFATVLNETSRDIALEFIASDGKEEVSEKIIATVVNKNKAPEIVDFSDDLIVSKNQPVLFEVIAVDGDNDLLKYEWKFSYLDKFEGESKHQRIFTTTGSKKVKVTVSDGIESVEKIWNVEVV